MKKSGLICLRCLKIDSALFQEIKSCTRDLLDDSESYINIFKESDQKQVILMRTLVSSDLRNINNSTKDLLANEMVRIYKNLLIVFKKLVLNSDLFKNAF